MQRFKRALLKIMDLVGLGTEAGFDDPPGLWERWPLGAQAIRVLIALGLMYGPMADGTPGLPGRERTSMIPFRAEI